MRIVLDTHVLVSGLLNPHNPPGRIVDAAIAGQVTLLFDDRVLEEYRAVLKRPRSGFAPEAVADLLDFIEIAGEPVAAPPLAARLPDPGDLPFLEVAAAGRAASLVTGNVRHFPVAARPKGLRVELPAAFVRRLARV